jgi:hypothetical protein
METKTIFATSLALNKLTENMNKYSTFYISLNRQLWGV